MSLLAAWTHDLDNCAVHAFGRCLIRWYGLSYVAGFAAAWFLIRELIRHGRSRLTDPIKAGDFVFAVAVGAIVGGRLGYVLLYDPSLLWSFGGSLPWWGVLRLHQGGMASHGGMLGVILASLIFARRERLPFLHAADLVSLAAPAGLLFGRLANFVNGELLGRPVASPGDPAPWWAVRFPQEILTRHAPRLTSEQELALARLGAEVAPDAETRGDQLEAIVDAVQRGVPGVIERVTPLLSARHPSQLYQAAAEGVVLWAVLWLVWARSRRDGMIGAVFLMLYGALRILTEHWRLPDEHLAAPTIAGLSRGQWYSAVMVVAGVFVWRAARRADPRVQAPAS